MKPSNRRKRQKIKERSEESRAVRRLTRWGMWPLDTYCYNDETKTWAIVGCG